MCIASIAMQEFSCKLLLYKYRRECIISIKMSEFKYIGCKPPLWRFILHILKLKIEHTVFYFTDDKDIDENSELGPYWSYFKHMSQKYNLDALIAVDSLE